MNFKGQGALEYLLIIGGAIVVAVIVVSVIISMSNKNTANSIKQNEQYEDFVDNTIIPPMLLAVDCDADENEVNFTINNSPTEGVTKYCLVVDGIPNLTTCIVPSSSTLTYNYPMTANVKYNFSLVAKKEPSSYSQPVTPSTKCTAHS